MTVRRDLGYVAFEIPDFQSTSLKSIDYSSKETKNSSIESDFSWSESLFKDKVYMFDVVPLFH